MSAAERAEGAGGVPLVLSNVKIRLDGAPLTEIDLSIAPGETLSVMGPSGSGKSTLLSFIAGFLDASFEGEGRVLLGEMDVTDLPPEQRGVALLFQDPLLFPHLSVRENVLFGAPRAASRGTADNRARAADTALADVGLDGFGDRDPATLSGGQQARVALLRAVFSAPRALLLDEPFSKLDTALRGEMRRLTAQILAQAQLPAVLVTHDEADAAALPGPVHRL